MKRINETIQDSRLGVKNDVLQQSPRVVHRISRLDYLQVLISVVLYFRLCTWNLYILSSQTELFLLPFSTVQLFIIS